MWHKYVLISQFNHPLYLFVYLISLHTFRLFIRESFCSCSYDWSDTTKINFDFLLFVHLDIFLPFEITNQIDEVFLG